MCALKHLKHLVHQGPVISAFGRTVATMVRQRISGPLVAELPEALPGPWLEKVVAPRSPAMIQDYVRHVGGEPRAYRRQVPAHLFPQWGFPLFSRAMEGLPYPLEKVLNGGCRLDFRAPLPQGEPLEIKARLEGIDLNERRVILMPQLVTGTASAPEAVVASMQAIVPLGRGANKRERPRVPAQCRELVRWSLKPEAGRAFAALTGDVNPIHWLAPYAKAAGFRNTILHGYATLARAIEGLNRHLWMGDVNRLRSISVRFTRPLVLPAKVGLFVDDKGGVFVGDAPGGAAYMMGTYDEAQRH